MDIDITLLPPVAKLLVRRLGLSRRFARQNSPTAAKARELIQQTLELMLKPKSRSDRRPS
jgi:hypothetical protein